VSALRLERNALQEELDSAERGITLLETKINAVREVCEDTWLPDVGEHTGEDKHGQLPFVEVYAILRALD
jgi:hypothetical protein